MWLIKSVLLLWFSSSLVEPQHSYYFSDALIYAYEKDGKTEELWLYVNPKTKQLLYVPNDDMIRGVISFPDGTYKIFGQTERGRDTVIVQHVPEVAKGIVGLDRMKVGSLTRVVNQANIQQKPIVSRGYRINYLKTIYVTKQIPINSRQIYGFSRLAGDARININLDYLHLLKPDQSITHIESKGFSLRLTNYGPNPYLFH